MMPVVWWNRNPEAIARGYWDQGLLEAIFSGELWGVPGGFEFVHCERDVFDGTSLDDGAVVVVPARHNVDHVARLNRDLSRLDRVLLILTGDEEGAFPFEQVEHPNMVAWVMTPQPGRDYGGARLIGSGWPPGIRSTLGVLRPGPDQLPWAFMGQVTHDRRRGCVDMLHERTDRDQAWLTETPGFTQGQPQDEYWVTLADAKVAPCPSGPCSPDSFRLYEALEAGCIPIADDRAPGDEGPQGYWTRIFGALPFPVVGGDWSEQSATIDWLLDGWPANANRVFAWWQRQKRDLAWHLHGDIGRLTGDETVAGAEPVEAITVIVTSSPTPHHPSTEHLEQVVASIGAQLPGVEIVLAFDGVRPELEHRRADYEEYVRRALWLANTRWRNVIPVVLDDWSHQAGLTRQALDEVRSRHLLFVEHDAPLTGEIDWPGIVGALDEGGLDMIRLHHETAIGEPHRTMMLDRDARTDLGGGVPLVRTVQWSQRPHVARVSWYRSILERYFDPSARTMIEDVMHGVCSVAWHEYGLAGWSRFRLALYAPPDNMQRSLHLDSRRLVLGDEETGDPKFPMRFVYPEGDVPEGAPQPR